MNYKYTLFVKNLSGQSTLVFDYTPL